MLKFQTLRTIPNYEDRKKMVADVLATFPDRFGMRGFPGDVFRCSTQDSYVNDAGAVTIYLERMSSQAVGIRQTDGTRVVISDTSWIAHSKGTAVEVRSEMIEVQS